MAKAKVASTTPKLFAVTPAYRADFAGRMARINPIEEFHSLSELYNVLMRMHDAFLAIVNQRRISNNKIAEDLIEQEYVRCFEMAEVIAEGVGRMQTVGAYSQDDRAHLLVDWAFRSGENVTTALAALADANAMPVKPLALAA